MKSSVTVHIGLGSNVGDREANLRKALAMLVESPGLEVRKISPFLDNPAVGDDDAPRFLNAAAEAVTTLSAKDLVHRLLDIEHLMGRVRREKWEPRIIDLDLLLHGSTIVATDAVSVPHPLMHERLFVLRPLAEIAPQVIHPVLRVTVADLLRNLSARPVKV
jgi:2-amino-4-hydroxy-6-hydroxymethyldihydropteridine diphosphokinase